MEKRLRSLLSVLSVLLLVSLGVVGWAWWRVHASLPQLDGEIAVAGLGAAVTVERDAAGVPTITGANRRDVARATGFVHAQDRFFQMDILRRTGAGELSELFGPDALNIDRAHRLHGFRALAGKVLAQLPAEHRALLEDYTAGVNAALQSSSHQPWEYVVLRTAPTPWRPEDSLLVAYAMWFDLQDADAQYEQSVRAIRVALGLAGLEFFAPEGTSWDSPLDGTTYPTPKLPPWRLKAGDAAPGTTAAAAQDSHSPLAGSNAFAVDAAHTAGGAALLANDMHLSLNVPHVWYRSVLKWTEPDGAARRIAGLMLPGAPAVIAGSNGKIAWGFTNAGVDTVDVVLVETEALANALYRTPHGWVEIEERKESINIAGKEPVPFTGRWTEWGPIIGGPEEGRFRALRWTAHDVEATNLNLVQLETADTAAAALAIAPRLGMPNQNLLVADTTGAIGWTVSGLIPRRLGYDGRQSVSWAFGDRKWDGWVPAAEIPSALLPGTSGAGTAVALTPEAAEKLTKSGVLWSANQRMIGGEGLARLGHNGYDEGARGGQIRDRLQQLASGGKVTPADLLGIQLDDRALYLDRWQKVLAAILTDNAVAAHRGRREMRDAVKQWNGRASVDSVAYRLVRSFHQKLSERALAPFFAKARDVYPDFSAAQLHGDDALWQLIQEKPDRLLNPEHHTWDELMLAAVDDVLVEVDELGVPMKRFTWGARNTLRMRHPFANFLPRPLAGLLSMPAVPLPGDNDMPRVQGRAFGASERMVVAPGHEEQGLLHLPGGQSGNPLSPFFDAGHEAWVKGEPTPFLPGPTQHRLVLKP